MKNLALTFPVLAMFLVAMTSSKVENRADTPTNKDQNEIEAALLDYVEGLYLVDTSRIYRSVSPKLQKRGFWYDKTKGKYSDPLPMTFEQLVKLTKSWNAKGNRADESSVRKVEVYDIMDKTASGKVTAVWGIDYCHLAKKDDKWVIMNILWQSPPPAKPTND